MYYGQRLLPLLLSTLLLAGCTTMHDLDPDPTQSVEQSIPEAPQRPENCTAYTGNWPVSFYFRSDLTLTETPEKLTLTAQREEESLSIELTRSASVMEEFDETFDFDQDLDALIRQMEESAQKQGSPFLLAGRLYGCAYPASWFQRQLKSDRWQLTVAHCFLYRQPEALLLEGTCTSGMETDLEDWMLEIALSLRGE